MIGEVPRWGLEDRSFAIEQHGRILAVVPLHHIPAARRLVSSGWGWVGPVLAAGQHPNFEAKILGHAFSRARAIAAQLGVQRIEVATPAVTPRSLGNRWGVSPFTAHGFADVSTVTRVIDLRLDEAELWKGLSADARQQIRRARDAGYSAAVESWAQLVEVYCRIHAETYSRSGLPAHPREYFDGFARRIDPAGLSALMVGRDATGRPVAFHNSVRFGTAAIYVTGCSESAHLGSGVNYLLFWEAMLAAKRAGCQWYEAGDVAAESADAKLRGLSTFKKKFGGEDHRYFRGLITLVADNARSNARTAGQPDQAASPSFREALAQWHSATRAMAAAALGPRWRTRLQRMRGRVVSTEELVEPRNAAGMTGTGTASLSVAGSSGTQELPAQVVRSAYLREDLYPVDGVSIAALRDSREYADIMLTTKLELVRRHYSGGVAVDLCCATGGHLLAVADDLECGIGVDFTLRYLQRAKADAAALGRKHISFICGDAERMPLASGCATLIYSLSSLYQVSGIANAVAEIGRTLQAGGVAILDLGNSRSLNAYCVRTGYPDLPMFAIPISEMLRLCAANRLDVIQHRRFQLLPLWAGKPDWLAPLLHPAWRRFLQRRVSGRMLDEWVSSLPGLRAFAFRHLLVCRKL